MATATIEEDTELVGILVRRHHIVDAVAVQIFCGERYWIIARCIKEGRAEVAMTIVQADRKGESHIMIRRGHSEIRFVVTIEISADRRGWIYPHFTVCVT